MKTFLPFILSLSFASSIVGQIIVPPGDYLFQRRQVLPATGYDPKPFPPVALGLISFDASLNPVTTSISTYGRTLIQSASASALANSILPTQINGQFLSTNGSNWVMTPLSTVASTGSYSDLSGKPTIPSAQVNSDWNAVSGVSQILNRPSLALVATSGAYSDLSGLPSIPSAQVNSDWSSVSGVSQILNKPVLGTAAFQNSTAFDPAGSAASAQAFAIQRANQTGTQLAATISDFSTAALSAVTWSTLTGKPSFAAVATTGAFSDLSGIPTTLSGYGITDAYPLSGNPSGFLTGITSGQVTTALGFTPYNATNPSVFITQSGARTAISLTTTGSSGAATYSSSTGVLNVPSYSFSLPNVGTPGTYVSVTTDSQGRVTSGNALSINNSPGRSLVTVAAAANGWQVSSTRNAEVRYSVTIVSTASLSGAQSGYVVLEICPTNSSTAGDWVEIARVSNGQSVALAIALTAVATGGGQINGSVPAGYYVRQRSVNVSGTPTFTTNGQQEILY